MPRYLSEREVAEQAGTRIFVVRRAVERGRICADALEQGTYYFRSDRLAFILASLGAKPAPKLGVTLEESSTPPP